MQEQRKITITITVDNCLDCPHSRLYCVGEFTCESNEKRYSFEDGTIDRFYNIPNDCPYLKEN